MSEGLKQFLLKQKVIYAKVQKKEDINSIFRNNGEFILAAVSFEIFPLNWIEIFLSVVKNELLGYVRNVSPASPKTISGGQTPHTEKEGL